ncbi:hypothetical protein [Ornithinimicrobium kibberense]|uniref:hypothetical protein n=1 Tax=Ornithinimicrobium kibberense TaxID=282060 RepID=UPI003605D51D
MHPMPASCAHLNQPSRRAAPHPQAVRLPRQPPAGLRRHATPAHSRTAAPALREPVSAPRRSRRRRPRGRSRPPVPDVPLRQRPGLIGRPAGCQQRAPPRWFV